MIELKIPFAMDAQEELYSPGQATKGETYFCPNCRDNVILKRGETRTAHFAHRASLVCAPESVTHKTAKQLIKKAVLDWKAGKGACPEAKRQCKGCQKHFFQRLPTSIDEVILEHRLPEGFIVDVALISRGNVVAAVEVKVTHAVDDRKHEELSISYIEVDGYKIIDNPLVWVVIADKLKSDFCSQRCKQAYLKRKQDEQHKQEFVAQEKAKALAHGMTLSEWIIYKKARPIIKKMVADGMTEEEFERESIYYSQSHGMASILYGLFNDYLLEKTEEEEEAKYEQDILAAKSMGITIEQYYKQERERLEQERLKQEWLKQQEQQRLERIHQEQERLEQERLEQKRLKEAEDIPDLITFAKMLAGRLT